MPHHQPRIVARLDQIAQPKRKRSKENQEIIDARVADYAKQVAKGGTFTRKK